MHCRHALAQLAWYVVAQHVMSDRETESSPILVSFCMLRTFCVCICIVVCPPFPFGGDPLCTLSTIPFNTSYTTFLYAPWLYFDASLLHSSSLLLQIFFYLQFYTISKKWWVKSLYYYCSLSPPCYQIHSWINNTAIYELSD